MPEKVVPIAKMLRMPAPRIPHTYYLVPEFPYRESLGTQYSSHLLLSVDLFSQGARDTIISPGIDRH